MTSQNPAMPNSQAPNLDDPDKLRQRDILAKVNAHADRSIDRLFADIDELLSGDLSDDARSSALEHIPQHTRQSAESTQSDYYNPRQVTASTYPAQSDFNSPPAVELPQTPALAPQQRKKGMPFWMKALLSIGVISIASSGLLLWLVNEKKIELPKNIDTSWLPFQSKSQVSPEDVKFAEYMRKSISKIETASTQATATPVAIGVNPAPSIAPPATQAAPTAVATNPNGIVAIQPNTGKVAAPQSPIALLKIMPIGNRPGAVFKIDSQDRTVKKTGGELRSIRVGQKF
jgi:hypothetical protein